MSRHIIELLSNSIESSTCDTTQFKSYLQSCLEHGSFYSQDNVEAVVKIINNSLNSSLDKEKGLILLQFFLLQISVETFSRNATSWMISCNKIINQKEGINSALPLKVLNTLIKLSVKFPEVNKEVAKQIVPKLLLDQVRRRPTPQVSVELLECVQSCMEVYPGPSGEFRLDIVKLLLSTVEARSDVVAAASRCVPLVAGVGGGGKLGVSHKIAWQRQQIALVKLLHSLLNSLYEHVDCQVMETVVVAEDIQLTLEPVNDRNILTKSQRLVTQFSSVALFLQAMLLDKFPVAKAVAPDTILDVVLHAQKPTLATLDSSREALAVTAVLPTVQVAALRLLESLVLCLGRNLVPQGGLVCYLCSQIVHWTYKQYSNWPYGMDKPFSQTRHAAYCCLHSWLTVAGTASQLETVVDKVLPPMLADIHMEKPYVTLRVGSKTGKGKKKHQVLVNQEDRSEKLGDPGANSRLCERALLTLVLLLRTTMAKLKPNMVTSITNTVLRLIAELPVPYSDANCLIALYQLLLTLCLESHPHLVSPLAPALALFTAGTHHPVATVRAACAAALSSLDKAIHPSAATLYFSMVQGKSKAINEVEDEETNDEDSTPVKKKMRIEPCNIQMIDLEETSERLDEKLIKMVDWDESNDSEEIVVLVPIENKTQEASVGGELVKMDDEIDGEIDVVNIVEDEETVDLTEDMKQTGLKSETVDLTENMKQTGLKSETVSGSRLPSAREGQDRKAEFHNAEESKASCSTPVGELKDQVESEQDLKYDKDQIVEGEDADVSQMLKDFTDEVNESMEN